MSDEAWKDEAITRIEVMLKETHLDSTERDQLNEIIHNATEFVKDNCDPTLDAHLKIKLFEKTVYKEIYNRPGLYKTLKDPLNLQFGPGSEPWWDKDDTAELEESMIGSEEWWKNKN